MKKLLNLLLIALFSITFSSCSDKDEPVNTDKARQQYENIVKLVYDDITMTPCFTPAKTEGLYVAVADNLAQSQQFIEKMIGEKWNGKSTIISLGEYGQVKLTGHNQDLESDGIYNEVSINVKGYKAFTLKILDKARANDDNGYTGGGVALVDISYLL